MFESLSNKLGSVFDGLRGRGRLSEDDVNMAAREIRVALLEADVALPVVKDFIENVKQRAIGQDVIKSVSPAQQVIKIVNDAMIELLGGDVDTSIALQGKPPMAYLMVGLQGSGKTTSTAKIAHFLTKKHNKKVLMASLDTYRPAAQEQLATLGQQTNIASLPIVADQKPLDITKRALETARLEGYDIVMLDTAGRLSIDDTLMKEVEDIRDLANPAETLLVADAMTGQDAVNTAQTFHERVGISGIMLTRVDGDARGGAAMSMRAITGQPVKLIGTGEQWEALEPFHPERIVSRILGMGDVVSLVEKAVETIDRGEAEKAAEKFKKGQFDLDDMLTQMQQMKKMGGMSSIMKMMPGLSKMAGQLQDANIDDTFIKRQEAILTSMTKKERAKPALLNASRKKRVAAGSGTSVQDINKLLKQHQQMATVMKRMKKMGMGGMMKSMKGLMGGGNDSDMMEQLEALQKDPSAVGPLGPNPFENMGGGGMSLPGLGGSGFGRKKGKKK